MSVRRGFYYGPRFEIYGPKLFDCVPNLASGGACGERTARSVLFFDEWFRNARFGCLACSCLSQRTQDLFRIHSVLCLVIRVWKLDERLRHVRKLPRFSKLPPLAHEQNLIFRGWIGVLWGGWSWIHDFLHCQSCANLCAHTQTCLAWWISHKRVQPINSFDSWWEKLFKAIMSGSTISVTIGQLDSCLGYRYSPKYLVIQFMPNNSHGAPWNFLRQINAIWWNFPISRSPIAWHRAHNDPPIYQCLTEAR